MKHLLIGFGALLAILIVAAVLAPSFVDWNRYRGEIARRVEEATGRPLAIDGNIALALLPTPRLTVGDVRLASLPGSTAPDLLRLKALEARVAFAALLAGRVKIESLALIEPQLNLERLADGRGNWRFASAAPAGTAAGEEPAGAEAAPFPSWLQLDHITIENGAVSYRDARTGRLWTLGQINGGLSAGSPLGPFRAQGHALFAKLPLTIDASLERLGGKSPAGVGLRVGLTGAQLDFSGSMQAGKDGPEFAGKLRASSPDLSAAATGVGLPELAGLPAFKQSLALESALSTAGQKLVLSQLSLRLGASEATGSVTYTPGSIGRAAATLSLTSVDLEKWLPGKAMAGGRRAGKSGETAAAASAKPFSFTLPDNIEATLDAALDGVLYKGGVIRQIRFGAALNKGELALTQLTAELPGGSDVTLYGALRTPKGQPLFAGNIEAASDNLRALLDWLKLDVKGVPAERLRRLSLSAALQLDESQLQLRDVDAVLDSSHLVGGATVLLQARPAFGASLAVDRLNLDAYLPQTSPSATPVAAAKEPAAAAATAAVAVSDGALALLDTFDANLRLRVDELIYRGASIRGIRVDGMVDSGAVTLREASVDDLAGLRATLKGSVGAGNEPRKLDASFALSAAELAGALRFAGWKAPPAAEPLGAATLTGHVAGTLDKLAVELSGAAMDGSCKIAGSFGLRSAGVAYDLEASARAPHLARLIALWGGDAPTGDLGALEFSGHVSGDGSKLTVSGLNSRSGLLSAAGDFSIAGLPHKHTLGADLKLAIPRLGTLLAAAGVKAGAGLDRLGPGEGAVKLDGERTAYRFDGKMGIAGGSFALAGTLGEGAAGRSYDATIDAEAPELAALLPAFLPGYKPASPTLGAFQLHLKAVGDREKLALSELQAKLGPTSVSGTVSAALAGPRPKLKLVLEANAIALDPFLPAADVPRAANRRVRGQAVSDASTRWSTAPLAFSALNAVDAEISLKTPELDYGQYHVADAALAATLGGAVLTVSDLTGKLYDGALKITGALDAGGEPKAGLSLRLAGAKLGEAGLKLGAVKLAEGTLDAEADLAASGNSELGLARGLEGKGQLQMTGGTIDGLDLNAVNARLAAPGRAADLLALVRAVSAGGATKIDHLRGTFTVSDGVAENKDLTIAADAGSAKGQGSIDLPRWYMEYALGITLAAGGDAPPFYIKLKGAPDAPRKFLDANAFQEWLIKREAAAVKSLRKGAAPQGETGGGQDKLIQNILKSLPKSP